MSLDLAYGPSLPETESPIFLAMTDISAATSPTEIVESLRVNTVIADIIEERRPRAGSPPPLPEGDRGTREFSAFHPRHSHRDPVSCTHPVRGAARGSRKQ